MEPGPWDECCAFCLQRYIYEEERRCTRCDVAVCPACVVLEGATGEPLCPPCGKAYEEDRRS